MQWSTFKVDVFWSKKRSLSTSTDKFAFSSRPHSQTAICGAVQVNRLHFFTGWDQQTAFFWAVDQPLEKVKFSSHPQKFQAKSSPSGQNFEKKGSLVYLKFNFTYFYHTIGLKICFFNIDNCIFSEKMNCKKYYILNETFSVLLA